MANENIATIYKCVDTRFIWWYY